MGLLVISVVVLAHVLRLRAEVLLALPCLWLFVLWLATAEKTGEAIAVVLTVVVLVSVMVWADRPFRRRY